MLGREVGGGAVKEDNSIPLSDLSAGLYIFSLKQNGLVTGAPKKLMVR